MDIQLVSHFAEYIDECTQQNQCSTVKRRWCKSKTTIVRSSCAWCVLLIYIYINFNDITESFKIAFFQICVKPCYVQKSLSDFLNFLVSYSFRQNKQHATFGSTILRQWWLPWPCYRRTAPCPIWSPETEIKHHIDQTRTSATWRFVVTRQGRELSPRSAGAKNIRQQQSNFFNEADGSRRGEHVAANTRGFSLFL